MRNHLKSNWHNRVTKRVGFTLVELLVVISIISVLMSILLPTLNRVRERAKRMICLSNCKQWSIAIDVYASNNDYYYPIRWGAVPRTNIVKYTWTPPFIYYYNTGDARYTCDLLQSLMEPYGLAEEKYADCPSDGETVTDYEQQRNQNNIAQGQYGLFPSYHWDSINRQRPELTFCRTPAKSSGADSAMPTVGDKCMYIEKDPRFWCTAHPPASFQEELPLSSGMNSAFADGSARWIDHEQMTGFYAHIETYTYIWPNTSSNQKPWLYDPRDL